VSPPLGAGSAEESPDASGEPSGASDAGSVEVASAFWVAEGAAVEAAPASSIGPDVRIATAKTMTARPATIWVRESIESVLCTWAPKSARRLHARRLAAQ
jgi:hypothetical protein